MTYEHAFDLSERIANALRNVEPGSELDQVLQRWEGFEFTVQQDGEWLLEGFINFFQNAFEIVRAVDPSIPPQLPPQCFNTESIARLFRLPEDAFTGYRREQPSGELLADIYQMVRDVHTATVEGPQQRLARLSPMERDLLEAASANDPSSAAEICARTKIHHLDSRTKQCLSNLVKFGLLIKVPGRRGYLRAPVSHNSRHDDPAAQRRQNVDPMT